MRTRTRIDRFEDVEICRIDVARSSDPVMARMSDKNQAFWVRTNNSTRALGEGEADEYVADHWRRGAVRG